MSRSLDNATVAELMAAQTSDVILVLLKITPQAGDTVYLADNTESVTYDGQEYVAFPFQLTLPTDENGQVSTAQLTIDNVSRSLIDEVRGQEQAMTVDIYIVNASNSPVTLEASFSGFCFKEVTYDAFTITGKLVVENYVTEPFPKDILSGTKFPGLF